MPDNGDYRDELTVPKDDDVGENGEEGTDPIIEVSEDDEFETE